MKTKTRIHCFFLLLLSTIVSADSEICNSAIPFSRCSSNNACGCFPMLIPCGSLQECSVPDHICVHHSRCNNHPICYPLSLMSEDICPPQSNNTTTMTTTTAVEVTTRKMKWNRWKQNAITVAGGYEEGNELYQLRDPHAIVVDKDKNIYITDRLNHRVMKWKLNEVYGEIVAGGNGNGTRLDQLNSPTGIVWDEENNSLIIADYENRRVVRWFMNENRQEIIINNIHCDGLALDKYGFLYVSIWDKGEVRRWRIGEEKGTEGKLVAGGNGWGNELNQLYRPTFIFVDDEQTVYVTDCYNHRVMKWKKNAKEGVIVAGENVGGWELNQLYGPEGLFVGESGEIYVMDRHNGRVMHWNEGAKEGELIVGGNKWEYSSILDYPHGLTFDIEGNLYVSDTANHRIQKFDLLF
ncbi:unnamed protein product [Adineta ricciae]|uniref:Uncharacterized protein n=1 Tax=Adineta ricciae TaxID=249248 RepID=A0A815LG48_ADIRI|nr:unnamed protein product [Adineta ricciae]CAF1445272.1 unnamed protein product [Adineta ricciae]